MFSNTARGFSRASCGQYQRQDLRFLLSMAHCEYSLSLFQVFYLTLGPKHPKAPLFDTKRAHKHTKNRLVREVGCRWPHRAAAHSQNTNRARLPLGAAGTQSALCYLARPPFSTKKNPFPYSYPGLVRVTLSPHEQFASYLAILG